MSKKILLITDGNSIFIHDTIAKLKEINPTLQFELLPTNYAFNKIPSLLFKKIHTPTFVMRLFLQWVSLLNHDLAFYLMRFFLKNYFKKSNFEYDFVHIHFLNKNLLYIPLKNLEKLENKLIISIWGSDFYKRTEAEKKRMIPFLQIAKKITIANEQVGKDFISQFDFTKEKIQILKFGLSILDEIKKITSNNEQKILPFYPPLPPHTLVITIGYSSHPDHQHFKIIKVLSEKLPEPLLKNIFFVFPLTYGDQSYRKKLKKFISQKNLNYILYTCTLSNKEIATIRIHTDIMIHLRKTDMLSGSFQEHLFAGNVVITGKWLPYGILKEKGCYFHEIDAIDELPEKILYVVENMAAEKEKAKVNVPIIYEISSWEKVIQKHVELYS